MVAWMIQESVVCLCLGSLIRSFTGAGCVTKRTAELELLREENVSADRTNILIARRCKADHCCLLGACAECSHLQAHLDRSASSAGQAVPGQSGEGGRGAVSIYPADEHTEPGRQRAVTRHQDHILMQADTVRRLDYSTSSFGTILVIHRCQSWPFQLQRGCCVNVRNCSLSCNKTTTVMPCTFHRISRNIDHTK